jgi:diguanylate cyclase (GGDEF)-like protein
VIKALAHLLRNRLRVTDLVGRYGGDEFMVIFPDTKGSDVMNVLTEITDRFQHIQFDQRGESFSCTLSVGVADNLHFQQPARLVEAADNALFEVKRMGRNAVKLAEGGMREEGARGH